MKRIDCHVHLNAYNKNQSSNLQKRLKNLKDVMAENKIDYSIILSSYLINSQRPSTYTLIKLIENCDNFRIVAGFSADNNSDEDLRKCRKWLQDGKIVGFKLYCGYEHYFPQDKKYKKIYEIAQEFDVPVFVHCGDTFSDKAKLKYAHPLNVDEVAVDNPGVKIIICHLGNPWILDCQEILYKTKNVYADISGLFYGVPSREYMKLLVSKVKELFNYVSNPHRVIFGTDWPISDIRSYLKLVSKLGLSQTDMELLMFENANKIFKFE
jgi:uncharacterized protein